jgi:uncharacterized protein YlzI (FlbEa/FlbD family)
LEETKSKLNINVFCNLECILDTQIDLLSPKKYIILKDKNKKMAYVRRGGSLPPLKGKGIIIDIVGKRKFVN